jgi:hypothetical protein
VVVLFYPETLIFMEQLLPKLVLFLHGALGGVILLLVDKVKTYKEGLKMILVSGISSACFAPGVAQHYGWGEHVSAACATLIGLGSWKLVQGVIKLLNKFAKDPVDLINTLWRKKS